MRETKKPEGVYGETGGHFFIHCECGSGKGCTYKDSIKNRQEEIFDETEYRLDRQVDTDVRHYSKHLKEYKMIYYANLVTLESMLWEAAFKKKLPLVLVCDDCKTEFNLTPDLFKEVVGREVKDLDNID